MDARTFQSPPVAVTRDVSPAVAESLRRLRHDLGKSMSLQVRFAGPDASDEDLVEALREDICRTRRSRRATTSAFELFDAAWLWLTGEADLPGFPGVRADLSGDEVVIALRSAFSTLRFHEPAIRAETLRGRALADVVALAKEGTTLCRTLAARYAEVPDG